MPNVQDWKKLWNSFVAGDRSAAKKLFDMAVIYLQDGDTKKIIGAEDAIPQLIFMLYQCDLTEEDLTQLYLYDSLFISDPFFGDPWGEVSYFITSLQTALMYACVARQLSRGVEVRDSSDISVILDNPKNKADKDRLEDKLSNKQYIISQAFQHGVFPDDLELDKQHFSNMLYLSQVAKKLSVDGKNLQIYLRKTADQDGYLKRKIIHLKAKAAFDSLITPDEIAVMNKEDAAHIASKTREYFNSDADTRIFQRNIDKLCHIESLPCIKGSEILDLPRFEEPGFNVFIIENIYELLLQYQEYLDAEYNNGKIKYVINSHAKEYTAVSKLVKIIEEEANGLSHNKFQKINTEFLAISVEMSRYQSSFGRKIINAIWNLFTLWQFPPQQGFFSKSEGNKLIKDIKLYIDLSSKNENGGIEMKEFTQ